MTWLETPKVTAVLRWDVSTVGYFSPAMVNCMRQFDRAKGGWDSSEDFISGCACDGVPRGE